MYTTYLGEVSLNANFGERRKFIMKKYIAPEMKALAFVAEEAISAPLEGSKLFNDGELEW